jgi:hypothetical protein
MYPAKLSANGYGISPTPSGQNSNLDICSFNSYVNHVWDNDQWRFPLNYPYDQANKRYINSEYGFDSGIDGCLDVEAHNAVWSGMFSGMMGTPLYFWDQHEVHGVDHHSKYKAISNFLSYLPSNMLLNKNPISGRTTTFGSSFLIGSTSVQKRIENFYMEFGPGQYLGGDPIGMGWVHNYSHNWYGLQKNGVLAGNNCPTPTITIGSNTYITTIPTYTPAEFIGYPDIPGYTYTEKGLYNITGISSPSSTEPVFLINSTIPYANYTIDFFSSKTGNYVYTDYATADATGKIICNIDLSNTNSGSNNPDLAYIIYGAGGFYRNSTKREGFISHDDRQSNIDLLLYPNPSNGIITLELMNASFNSVEIYNTMGQKLNEFFTNGERGIKIDLSSYGENVLMIKVNTKEGQVLMKKCVINN